MASQPTEAERGGAYRAGMGTVPKWTARPALERRTGDGTVVPG
jgi:hypothetical protein